MALEAGSGAAQLPPVHSLLRVAAPSTLLWENCAAGAAGVAPDWAAAALQSLPWVVVRRNAPRPALLPVGVRGLLRSQRAPAWLPFGVVGECVTPRMLAARAPWRDIHVESPAVEILSLVEVIVTAHGFAGAWGPGGSVAAELAGGVKCTTSGSDLDLILYTERGLTVRNAVKLQAELTALPVRIDALLETPQGGVALAEVAGKAAKILLRTAHGPRLIDAADGVAVTDGLSV